MARLRMPYTFKGRREPIEEETDRLGDPEIKTALKEDPDVQAACLAWLVRGAMKWYAAGRCQPLGDEPERVAEDSRAWRAAGDLIMNYVDEFLVFGAGTGVVASELHRHFSDWVESQGNKAWSLKVLLARMGTHDDFKGRGGSIQARATRSVVRRLSRPPGASGRLPDRYTAVLGVSYIGAIEEPEGDDPFEVG